ncbi:MAG: hypothetical protein ACPHX4_03535, partial [Candidatus Puniceispirillaceae bacterium]
RPFTAATGVRIPYGMPKLFPSFWILVLMRVNQAAICLGFGKAGTVWLGSVLHRLTFCGMIWAYAACTNQEPNDRFVPDKTAPDKISIASLR